MLNLKNSYIIRNILRPAQVRFNYNPSLTDVYIETDIYLI